MTDAIDITPRRGWVFFDSECPMCVHLARRFEETLKGRGFVLAPFESPGVRARLGLCLDQPLTEMKLLTRDGRSIGGAEAVVHLAREIWWAWPLYVAGKLPLGMPVLRRAYRWIAARRRCENGACTLHLSNERSARWPGWLPLLVLPSGVTMLRHNLEPWLFMWALAIAIFAGCKWLTWWQNKSIAGTRTRRLGYLLAWPGMDAEAFLNPATRPQPPTPAEWIWAVVKTIFGAALLWSVARRVPSSLPLLRGWVGLVALVFLLHFGTFHILALLWKTAGVPAEPIMRKPALATSLSDFWGKRWNLGFHRLAGNLIFQPLRNRLGSVGATFAAFLMSGLIHDLVISFPAGGGYGLPTAYFTLQAAGLLFERSRAGRALGLRRGVPGWLFTQAVAGGPAFWLFHPWFVTRVIIPFLEVVRAL